MLSTRNLRIHASLLLVLANAYCTGVPAEPKASPVAIEWVAAGVQAWADWQLAEPLRLRVDLQAPAGTHQAVGWFVPGEVEVDEVDDLSRPPGATVRMVLNGGVDATRPLVYGDVAPGTYTVCGQLFLTPGAEGARTPIRCARVEVTDAAESRMLVLRG